MFPRESFRRGHVMLTCGNTARPAPGPGSGRTFAPPIVDQPGPHRDAGNVLQPNRGLQTRPRFEIHVLVHLDPTHAQQLGPARLRQPQAVQPALELRPAARHVGPRFDPPITHDALLSARPPPAGRRAVPAVARARAPAALVLADSD